MRRFIAAGKVGGVPVYIHWTLVLGCAVLVAPSLESMQHAAPAFAALAAYFAAMVLHEWGHVFLARRRGSLVYGIELYPFVGLTRLERPRTRVDQCVIAWGGVLFQGAVGIPVLVWILVVGYTPLDVANAFMGVFGYLTLLMLPVNLAPVPPLDGAVAWGIVPIVVGRLRERLRRGRRKGWQSVR